jgi:hypothetical protein
MKDLLSNFPNQSGIYKITSPTGLIYVGEAINLKTRCKYYLNPNRVKKQRALYNSLIKYSPNNHKIEIIELCDKDFLKERERYWQEYYNSVECGLNCFLTPTNEKKKVHSQLTKEIISQKSSGKNNSFYGKKHSMDSLKKISESSKGSNNPNYGGKLKTKEWLTKQKISNSKVHLKVLDTFTNEEFTFINSKEVSDFLNCSPSNIRESKRNGWKVKKRYLIFDIV